ncbi:MAG TPA: HlyC/CorC family transporter [Gammaproteobacteria bacterium]|nr:HlyC/CorC family transporter [Gammaproteobacteria bacterium]
MDDIPLWVLFSALFLLIVFSAFFSGSETGLMSINRYRLRHLADQRHRGAMRAQRLLERPERLIGLILLGNNFVNILASAIATVIGLRLLGETGIAVATFALTIVVLIFAEVTPKTIAALHPEKYALPAALVLEPLLKLLYPLVWLINRITDGLFRILGIRTDGGGQMDLSAEELRVVVNEAGAMIPRRHQQMLLSILDLEKATVEDIMVPRNEIVGIDITDPWEDIVKQLTESQHTRLPVYEDDIDHVIGMVHLRRAIKLFQQGEATKDDFREVIHDAYFIPEGVPLNTQLINFQKERRRIGLVVNEYGEIQGLVTLEDILEEIVGEFTTDPAARSRDIHRQEDGAYLVDASIPVRELNKFFHWHLPTDGPKTLNGLIIEHLESIPDPGTSMLLDGHPVEIVQTSQNAVKTVLINPALQPIKKTEADETED